MDKIIKNLTDAIAYGILIKERDLSSKDIASMLETIRDTFLQQVEEAGDLRLEIDRLVFGQKFKILSRRDLPFDEIEGLYQDLLSIGFSNLMEEGTVGIYYAQFCIRHQKFKLAKEVLEVMLLKAMDVSTGPPSVRKQLARDACRALDELRLRET